MKYPLVLILPLFLVISTQAQSVGGHSFNISFDRNSDVRLHKNDFEKLEGSPFFNKDWVKGRVILANGSKTNRIDLKYSSYTNQLLFKRDGQVLEATPDNFIGFNLKLPDGNVLFKKGFQSSEFNITSQSILEVIYSGSVKVLLRHDNRLHERKSDPMTGEVTKRFIDKAEYFFVNDSGKFHKIKLNKENILNNLSSHKKELQKFAENNDLAFDKKNDLSKILSHYDTLIAS